MTPDEARALLDGTTPGPWEWRWDTGLISLFGAKGESVATDLEVQDSDLTAAAPTLAAMVAGMRTEYRAEYRETWGEWIQLTGWTTEESARHALMPDQLKDAPKRVLVRYVTNEEEIS